MARNNHITNSFIAGEASPRFLGRTDTQQYNQSCRELTNSIVFPQGGAARRAGTLYGANITNVDGETPDNVRFIPFSASDGTRWVLVITSDLPDHPVGYNPNVDTYQLSWHAYEIGSGEVGPRSNIFYSWDVTYFDDLLKNYYDFSDFDMNRIQFAQSGDTIVVTSGIKAPFVIQYSPSTTNYKFLMTRYPDPVAAFVTPQLWKQIPYKDTIVSTASKAIALDTTNAFNLKLAVPGGSGIVFNTSWLGRYIKFTKSNVSYVVVVIEINSTTSVRVQGIAGTQPASGIETYGGATATRVYAEGQWNDTDGWPNSLAFFESRLVFGGSKTFPDRLWFSQVNDIYEITFPDLLPQEAGFADPQVTSDAFQAELKQTLLSDIRWMNPGRTLIVGTGSREFVCQGPDQTKTIGIDNFISDAETPHGSAPLQAFRLENTTIFLQRDGRRLRELVYNEREDSFRASNLSSIGEHMHLRSSRRLPDETFKSRFIAMAYQEIPYGIVWLLDAYGALVGLTREREQNVAAWHYHYLGGDGRAISMAVLPRENRYPDDVVDTEDDILCLAVRRTVDTGPFVENRIHLELMQPQWDQPTISSFEEDIQGPHFPVYMDCVVPYSNADQVSDGGDPGQISCPQLGRGSVVDVVCDGIYLGKKTVASDGTIDISGDIDVSDAWQALVGFTYPNKIVPVIPEVPARTGSSMGLPRRIERVVLSFYRTCAAWLSKTTHSADANTPIYPAEKVVFPELGSGEVPMFTGPRELNYPLGYDNESSPVISSEVPLPLEVTHLTSKIAVYE